MGQCRTLQVVTETNEADDWAQALAGSGQAFARVYDRHRDRVFRHGYGLVSNVADAEDVLAVVFLEAWRRRESVRLVNGSVLPWLLVASTNTARNVRRSTRRYSALLAKLPPGDDHPDHADSVDDGEALTALRALPLKDRQVLTLCAIQGLTDADAAKVLGVRPGTVRVRLLRARSRLAGQLSNHSIRPVGEPHEA